MENKTQIWYDKLDQIDPFFGDSAQLKALLLAAPTAKIGRWLAAQIENNNLLFEAIKRSTGNE